MEKFHILITIIIVTNLIEVRKSFFGVHLRLFNVHLSAVAVPVCECSTNAQFTDFITSLIVLTSSLWLRAKAAAGRLMTNNVQRQRV